MPQMPARSRRLRNEWHKSLYSLRPAAIYCPIALRGTNRESEPPYRGKPGLPGSPGREQIQNFPKALTDSLHFRGRLCREWNGGLPLLGFVFRAQLVACADDGEALLVE